MKLTKKLFIAIMTMALLVVTFTTSTFAWFTIGTTGKVENITVDVTAGTGMEIARKEDLNWRNKIQLTNPDNLHFTAVTTLNGLAFYDAENGALRTTSENVTTDLGANLKYYEQTFFVRITKTVDPTTSEVGSAVKRVLLNEVTGTNNSTSTNWIADVSLGNITEDEQTHAKSSDKKYGDNNDKEVILGETLVFDSLNAVKVSFSTLREPAANQAKVDTPTLFYGYENATSWGKMPTLAAHVVEVENTPTEQGKEVKSGLAKDYADAKDYDLSKVQPYTIDSNATKFPTYIGDEEITAAKQKSDEQDTITTEELNAATVLLLSDFVEASVASAQGGILEGETLNNSYLYAQVTVRIWLDGWDADCINAILAQKTVFSFKLKAVEE